MKSILFSFPKNQKLKSRKTIAELFENGRRVKHGCLMMVYTEKPSMDSSKIGVSVSKRLFKKAVDRNFIKRQLRETYRLHPEEFQAFSKDKKWAIMLIYQCADKKTLKQIKEDYLSLLRKAQP